jgi:hypothetical protein
MRIALQLLTTLIFLALFPAIVLGTLILGIMAIWRKGKTAIKPTPTNKTDKAQVPLTSDGEAMRNIDWSGWKGDPEPIDWAKVSVCDPNKKCGTS